MVYWLSFLAGEVVGVCIVWVLLKFGSIFLERGPIETIQTHAPPPPGTQNIFNPPLNQSHRSTKHI